MDALMKFSSAKYYVQKYKDTCTIDVDKEIYETFSKKKRKFFRKDGHNQLVDEQEYLDKFANQLYSVELYRETITLDDSDDKVSIKHYDFRKLRMCGVHYFVKKQSVSYLTYNKKTKMLYVGLHHNKKRLKGSIAVNPWNPHTIPTFFSTLVNRLKNLSDDYQADYDKIIKTFFGIIYGEPIKVTDDNGRYQFRELLLLKHFKENNIKYPNNYLVFYNTHPLPKLVEIRKGGNNLITAIQKKHNLHGKKFNRILHNVTNLNFTHIEFLRNIIDDKQIKNLPDHVLTELIQSDDYVGISRGYMEYLKKITTPTEKQNIFNCYMSQVGNRMRLYTFIDHIKFYVSLRVRYNEDVKWSANNISSFNAEHVDFSTRIKKRKEGVWDRKYSEGFMGCFDTQIISPQGGVYYPVVLTKDREYTQESNIQSNCVKTYVQSMCVIISLREGSDTSKERATIEYKLFIEDGKMLVKRGQTLGRFNKPLHESWAYPVEELDNIINKAITKFNLEDFKLIKTTNNGSNEFNIIKNDLGRLQIENKDINTNDISDDMYFELNLELEL